MRPNASSVRDAYRDRERSLRSRFPLGRIGRVVVRGRFSLQLGASCGVYDSVASL
jgi:hypothetical protein